jgi:sensor histidine kinase YesM
LYDNRHYRFWVFQIVGWTGYSLVTFVSITLANNNFNWPHVGHIILSAILGILTSWPLRPLYRHTFDLSLPQRMLVASAAIVILSGLWTVLRVLLFAWIVHEPAIWREFNYWFFGSLFVFLSWTVLYYGITYYELLTLEHQRLLEESAGKRQEQFKRLQAEYSNRTAQLQMLRYQLNPHFLFNTLNSINALVKMHESSKAQEMIQRLSEFLRHSLERDGVESVSLKEELKSLMLYLDIEKVRFGDRLRLDLEIEPRAGDALVPDLILQPIVENAMKYAVGASEDGGTISINAKVLGSELLLVVSDTGPGVDASVIDSGRGVGLRNTLERLETLYEGRYRFDIVDNIPAGLSVCMRLPFELIRPESDPLGALQ